MRSTRQNQMFLQVIVDLCTEQPTVNDQLAFSVKKDDYPWNQLLKLTYLDQSLFPNGGLYWGGSYPAEAKPFIVHNNWIVGMNPKINRFKAANLWFSDLPAFFEGEDRYLTVTLPKQESSERAQALRTAISLAVHLKRVLIMPPDSQHVSIDKVKEIVPVMPHAEIFNCSHHAESSPFRGALLVDVAKESHTSACFDQEAGVSSCFQPKQQGFITVGEHLWATSTEDLLKKIGSESAHSTARLIVLTSAEPLPETLLPAQTLNAIKKLAI